MKRICFSCNRKTDWEFCPHCGVATSPIAPARDRTPISRQLMVRVLALSIVGVIASIGFCWLVYRPHRDDEAVKVIRAAGGEVTRESRLGIVAGCLDVHIFSHGAAYDVQCRGIQINAQMVEAICSLRDLRTWYCSGCKFEPEALSHLKPMPKLTDLFLVNSNLGDDDLANLRWLENLEYLSLNGTAISDKGIIHLSDLKRLRIVNLGGTNVTQTGRHHLKRLLLSVQIRN